MKSCNQAEASADVLVRWLPYRQAHPQAALRLFCLTYAGGSAAVFRTWGAQISNRIEVCPVQLPGREKRFLEPPFTRIDPLVEVLTRDLGILFQAPFALFGHSLGGILAFELARNQVRTGKPLPVHLFISGSRAAHWPNSRPPLYRLSDIELLEELRKLGGTPEGVLENTELMHLLLPVLRADFELIDTYIFEPSEPLDCPITAFGGINDPEVPPRAVVAWREHTRVAFRCRMFQANHFFIHDQQDLLLREIEQALQICL